MKYIEKYNDSLTIGMILFCYILSLFGVGFILKYLLKLSEKENLF